MSGFKMDDYIDVAERIRIFREAHPNGSLQPAVIEKPYAIEEVGGKTFIIYTAAAYRTPDDPRPGIGIAWEPVPGPTQFTKDSELQNAETAAWGRAIVAALAADTKKGIASRQEVQARRPESKPKPVPQPPDPNAAPESMKKKVYALLADCGYDRAAWGDTVGSIVSREVSAEKPLTKDEAQKVIDMLEAEKAAVSA